VLRGNEIEVIEFPSDGRLPSNMPAAKPPAHQSLQPNQDIQNQTNTNTPTATPTDSAAAPVEEISQPKKLRETDGDKAPTPELDDFSNLNLNNE